jgi:hypothetical protein
MTVEQLRTQLDTLPGNQEIVVDVRLKTGYDEGDIYTYQLSGVSTYKNRIFINLGGCELTGGW